jgi:pantoate--beta-alanine ligase
MNPGAAPSSSDSLRVVTTVPDLRAAVDAARAAGKSIGLVPTMGALHEGHLSLARAAQSECGLTIVTIFVNPTQFGPHEDFNKYPRTRDADLALLALLGVDLVFAPSPDVMYPAGFSTFVDEPAVAKRWEGQCRPGHFRGVTTVVLKLFNQTRADVAFFGHKDYQQSCVVRRMVADLDVPIAIRVCPTVREADGLAMSSRNRYLDTAERQQALAISRSLQRGAECVRQGQRRADIVIADMRAVLTAAGITRIDYVALVEPQTLEPRDTLDGPTIALIAAYVGTTRLIDNHVLRP